MFKNIIYTFTALILLSINGVTQPSGRNMNNAAGHPAAAKLSVTEKSCMDGILGAPESRTSRPSKAEHEAALEKCGIAHANKPQRPELTAEQKNCMDSILGKKEERSIPPSRDEMHKAFEKCGIKPPQHQRDN